MGPSLEYSMSQANKNKNTTLLINDTKYRFIVAALTCDNTKWEVYVGKVKGGTQAQARSSSTTLALCKSACEVSPVQHTEGSQMEGPKVTPKNFNPHNGWKCE